MTSGVSSENVCCGTQAFHTSENHGLLGGKELSRPRSGCVTIGVVLFLFTVVIKLSICVSLVIVVVARVVGLIIRSFSASAIIFPLHQFSTKVGVCVPEKLLLFDHGEFVLAVPVCEFVQLFCLLLELRFTLGRR